MHADVNRGIVTADILRCPCRTGASTVASNDWETLVTSLAEQPSLLDLFGAHLYVFILSICGTL